MIGPLLTLPARAAFRALWAAISTEPLPTLLFGEAEPLGEPIAAPPPPCESPAPVRRYRELCQ